MKEIQIRRHAEKDSDGNLTKQGEKAARVLGQNLPRFVKVISSSSVRTRRTAELLTGTEPVIDDRAGFYMGSQEESDLLNKVALEKGITFWEALLLVNNPKVLEGVYGKADELNQLIAELFEELNDDEMALVVSHDLTICPAMAQKGAPLASIQPLEGYIIHENGEIRATP